MITILCYKKRNVDWGVGPMKKTFFALVLTTLVPTTVGAAPITYNLRDPFVETIDEVNSFVLTQDGVRATLTASPTSIYGSALLLNQTASSFGVNVNGTTCNSLEDSATLDGGCGGEKIGITFSTDVLVNSLFVSSFGADAGTALVGSTLTNITSTGLLSLNNTFLAAGSQFLVSYTGGNGFSLDNFTVTAVPEPTTLALIGLGILSVGLGRRRNRS